MAYVPPGKRGGGGGGLTSRVPRSRRQEPPPIPRRQEPPPIPQRLQDKYDRKLRELIECLEEKKNLTERIDFLEKKVSSTTFMAERRLESIKNLKQTLENLKQVIAQKDELLGLQNTFNARQNTSYVLENYYVNPKYTNISAHGEIIPDKYFKVPEGFEIIVLSPVGSCTTFGSSKDFFTDVKMGMSPRDSPIVRGGVFDEGMVMFDVSLSFSDIKENKDKFMIMGVFPYLARPIFLKYSQLNYWFEHRGDDVCKKLFDKISDTGPKDIDDLIDAELCMESWQKNQNDIRYYINYYVRHAAARESTSLSLLLKRMDMYLKSAANVENHTFPTKIVLDCCLGFKPADTDGSKSAQVIAHLEEFKDHNDIVEKLPCCFTYDKFVSVLQPPLQTSSSIHRHYKRI